MILDLFLICCALLCIFVMFGEGTNHHKVLKWFVISMFVAFICLVVFYDARQIYHQIMSAYVPGLK